ncbi:TPA: PilC family type IV pilus tip adhesin, partial [Neisseria gonorrhoeae]
AQTYKYAIVMNAQNLPEVKWGQSYSSAPKKDRERQFTHTNSFKIRKNITISFDNTDNVVAQKGGTVVFGAATYLPPYGKVSGFDTDSLKGRGNAVDWISTTRPGLVGYSYENVTCHNNYFDPSRGCPEVVYKTQFTFGQQGLQRKAGNKLDIYEDKSRDNSPIYKLSDYPWLGVSFNLSSESLVKEKRHNKKIFYFNEDVTQQNSGNPQYKDQNLVYTTGDGNKYSSRYVGQNEHSAIAFYLNAKLHLLDKTQIKDITQGKTVDLGTLKPRIELSKGWKNRLDRFFLGNWTLEDKGKVSVNLGLPQVKAGRCINTAHPNKTAQAPSPALTAPALWFAVQNGKVQMYSASVSTYPGSSSSKIFLQNLSRNDDKNKPGRYSLKPLSENEIKSKEPSFNGRQTIIRLDSGVQLIKLNGSKDEVVTFGNTGNNGTFGIVKEANVNLEADEWKKVLLPWTVRGPDNDNKFKLINQKPEKYSQRYRIRDNNGNRDLGDIVNSPIVAVGGYLATAANDGMVHIFKKNGGSDERSYNLKLSYIPGTMPRKDIESNDSTLAKELRAFAEKGYVGDRYGVDGGFVLRRITDDQDKQKHFFMFGAMGLGGRGAYALDLSKIDGNYPAAAPLFDVKNGDNNGKNRVKVELGYTVGTPQIGKTQNGKYSAFLASGYAAKQIDDPTNKTALYVYDLENTSGSLIKKIEAPGGKGGLSSPTLVDKDLDGTIDIAYAGDRGGKMYRFDLSNSDPSKWSVSTIFEGAKPITSAPAVSRLADKRVVIFGTGSDLSEEDVVGKDQQYIYGIFDDDKGTVNVKVTNGTGGGLLEQTLTKENNTLFLSNNKASGGSNGKGWVVRLGEGERVTVKPIVVLRTAFVTIRSYTGNDKCGAQTAILGINTADGGALTPRSARPIVPGDQVAQYSGHQKMNGKSVPIGCMWKNGKTVCPNGYVYDKPVNVRYLDEKKTDDFPVTADGDAGGSGTFKEGKKPARNNRCFSKKGVRTLLMNDLDSLDITGPMCGIKRLSWREVFF